MDEKTRTNPFSISNILSSHSSRDNEEREFTTTSENERDKNKSEVAGDKGTVVGGSFTLGGIHSERKTPTHGDLYDWDTESTGRSPEKSLADFDRKYTDICSIDFSFLELTVVVDMYLCMFLLPLKATRAGGKAMKALWTS
jgi:hypothetical protein